jgi:hypothetical protein
VGTLLTNSPKRAPGALAPRGTNKGAQGPRVQLGNGLTRTKQKTDLGADDAKACTTVSCTEGRRYAGGELARSKLGREASFRLGLSLSLLSSQDENSLANTAWTQECYRHACGLLPSQQARFRLCPRPGMVDLKAAFLPTI